MSKPKKRRSFYFTPELEKQFNLVTVPGTNVNSNTTDARKTGVQALNFLAQEAARKDAEIESRSERKTTKRQTTVGERLRGDNGYSSYMSGGTGMSGRDPLLGTIFDWTVGAKGIDALGKTALWNYAKYVPTSGLGRWGRNYFVNLAFRLELRKPILFGLGKNIAESAYVSSAPKPSDTGLTSLKFFERPTYLSPLELAGATKLERNFTPRWHVAKYPGYLLKGLMGGSPLERQISKNGTISVNLLNAYFNKASQIEREVANKVLTEQFAGLKIIDYNLFKKAVLDELITYERIPLTRYAKYGMDRLGLTNKVEGLFEEGPLVLAGIPQNVPLQEPLSGMRINTFTFESPKIPIGNNKHYDASTLGHSRTYTTPEEPKVLHVMESQSDWGLTKLGNNSTPYTGTTKYLNDPVAYRKFIDGHKRLLAKMLANPFEYLTGAIERQIANIEHHEAILKLMLKQGGLNSLAKYLHDNYLQRQLQENLRYAAENGLTKMRYPTPETAAKIEGYLKEPWAIDELGNPINPHDFWNFERSAQNPEAPLETLFDFPKGRGGFGYSPEHQTILKKYADFPKLFLKLYKGLNVKTVTDAKGNTWYEIDVPKGYLSKEWQFKKGGKITINNIEI